MRIGQGFDVHAFTEGDHVVLGGIRIAHTQALRAHSDGDVLLHALMDALLGALALADIGDHFPDSDPRYAGADSRQLLRHVAVLVAQHGYRLANADMTIIAERPKIAPHREAMRVAIAEDLCVPSTAISVKATTSETLGFTGRGEGIAALATVLLEPAERTRQP